MKLYYLFLSALLLLACTNPKTPTNKLKAIQGNALGTTYQILYLSEQEIDTKSLDSIFEAVNQSMSTYLSNSDISKINKGDTTIQVDNMFAEVFHLSKNIYQKTNGYFDPTVGKLVNAWGFGPEKLKLEMSPAIVDSLLNLTGLDKITLNPNRSINKLYPNISLDFNAIAKGYCIDRIGEYFNKKNIVNYLIELGGELKARGNKEENQPWIVGIDHPLQKEKRKLITTLNLTDRAMATSGNYRKYRVDSKTGKKYVHTINPKTGYTQVSDILSASVLAKDCATADAYATAFMAMPLSETKKIVSNDPELETYIIFSTAKDSLTNYISEGFKKMLNN